MKLFLTSSGLVNKKLSDFFVSILPKEPKGCAVLMAAYDQTGEDTEHTAAALEELKEIGISNLAIFNLADEKFGKAEIKFDVIYVSGGNTFAILDRMKKTGFFDFVKKAVGEETIYAGISAGSVIAGKSIEIAGWGSEGDENEIGLTDLSGLGFTDIAIYPHFWDEEKEEVDQFKKKAGYPVIEITDDQAVYIDGETNYQII
jgi:dipeptidase E